MRFRNARSSKPSFARGHAPTHHASHRVGAEPLFIGTNHILQEHAMWINIPNARLALAARRGLRLKDARGTRLRAVQGTLWITIDNDLRDIVLDPGESFVVDSNKALVVMPLGDCATVDVKSVAPAGVRTPNSWLHAPWPRRADRAVAQSVPTPQSA
jgi:Protein of unknown function (DUF2917)